MPAERIYIGNKLFLGRVEEQKQFRAALHEVLDSPRDETLPYIFLLYGDGGMGKTTLAKRFCDIARDEAPFEGEFQILWMDWEDERRRSTALGVGHDHVRPETVFDAICDVATRAGWGGDFGAYQRAVKIREEAQKKAAAALEPSDERDEFAEVRKLGAGAIAKMLRQGLPLIGETGEKLAQMFLEAGIKVGAEEAARLRAALENRLRARLDLEQFNLFLYPNEQLAHALAEGLKRVAKRKPLLIVFDTYEIVDRADLWVREIMRAAGPRLMWIISGRNDLARSRQFGNEYFKGYSEEFPRRLIARDMLQLAQQDLREIFADIAPHRPLSDAEAEAFSRATRGVPLAIAEAAEMWGKGIALGDIIGGIDEATPRKEVVAKMTARYFLHVRDETDKIALYALALARGDVELVRAMLNLEGDEELRRLERAYASVHYDETRLHDDAEFFLREHLKEPLQRSDARVKALLQRAVDALQARLKKLQADLPRLEDRCADEDWRKAALDLGEYLFWLDESAAWRHVIPRFVESLAYSRELRRGLVEQAQAWARWLSASGKKRARLLRATDDTEHTPDELAELLDELTRLERLGYLQGEGEAERGATLDLWRGILHHARGRHTEALAQYERAERALPEDGEALKQQLGEALHNLAGKFLWPQGAGSAVYSVEAEKILPKVVAWLPENPGAWYRLGAVLNLAGRNEEALAAYQRASDLDPKDAYAHNGIGNVHYDLKQYDAALTAYRRASELDPRYAAPHNGIGNVHAQLGNYEAALAAYRRASELDPTDATPHNNIAGVLVKLGRYDEARREFNERIRLAPDNAFTPLVALGVLARHQGLAESDKHFQDALAQWEVAWRARWQSAAGLLKNKTKALLCLGRKDEALQTLKNAIAQMTPGDTIELDYWMLLQTAPAPPEGVEEAIALLKEAQAKRG
ncbi:MAG: tetratricopeptide repeat protein [Anaerolineales bacterium]|nr:tetratricopeptide repeat protein [Anaerolineales bacterium]